MQVICTVLCSASYAAQVMCIRRRPTYKEQELPTYPIAVILILDFTVFSMNMSINICFIVLLHLGVDIEIKLLIILQESRKSEELTCSPQMRDILVL